MNTRLKGAKQEGIEQGIQQEKIEVAKSMKEENIDISMIQRITKLTKEEIERL